MQSQIVYGGEQAPSELIDHARSNGIHVRSFVEYQGLIDFRGYLQRQKQQLENDVIYPSELYVPQHVIYDTTFSHDSAITGTKSDNALDTVAEWMLDERGRFVLLLADFGTGKTFLLHKLAEKLGDMPGAPVPLLIELRQLQKAQKLDELIAQHLVACGETKFELDKIHYMLAKGKIALLFDGFDELAQRVTYDRAAEHLDTLLEAAKDNAKVAVTCRIQHFETDQQIRMALSKRMEVQSSLRVGYLQPFTEDQIQQFLENLLGTQKQGDPTLQSHSRNSGSARAVGNASYAELHRRAADERSSGSEGAYGQNHGGGSLSHSVDTLAEARLHDRSAQRGTADVDD